MTKRLLWLIAAILVVCLAVGSGSSSSAEDDPVRSFIATLSTQEKVGQLFLVTFHGCDVRHGSEIAELIQRYRIGGVVLSPERGNFYNDGSAVGQVRRLSLALQRLAMENPLTRFSLPAEEEGGSPEILGTPNSLSAFALKWFAMLPERMVVHPIPLFIALEQEGNGYPHTSITSGLTQLPSAMAIGATWNPDHAEAMGRIVGAELASLGVNMLLGPSLDVLHRPQPNLPGDIGVRSFGGDPFWVGRMGQAFIAGVHRGSGGRVITVAKHFPGLGSSDRKASEEVATVQKSMQELKQIELAPFFAVTDTASGESDHVTEAMLTSPLIRYRGFQGNIRQLTRPIGLDAEGMAALMSLTEFQAWRQTGLLIGGPLGLPAVRRFYDPQMLSFPHKRIAKEALDAGNDIVFLCDFALEDDWESELRNIQETIEFFAERYEEDAAFRLRVDASLERILRLKLRLYPNFSLRDVASLPPMPDPQESSEAVAAVSQDAATLIYPGPEEVADRLPSPPLRQESILVFTDSRPVKHCLNCPLREDVRGDALERAIVRLYGPGGSGQVNVPNVHSASFEELDGLLAAQANDEPLTVTQAQLNQWLDKADWLVFLMQDVDVEEDPHSDAIKEFLKRRSDSMHNKHLIVFALSEPYYLDTTEVSKLTAYYALYSKVEPFIETAARVLFRELGAHGALPVDVQAVNYDLITRLEPDPNQVIGITVIGPRGEEAAEAIDVKVGSTLTVRTTTVLDCNGNPVPDGTPLYFRLYYPADSLELPRIPATTVRGVAEASITLERTGQLEVTVLTGTEAYSSTLVVSIQGDEPAIIATVMPPTPTPRPTDTPTPTVAVTTSTPMPLLTTSAEQAAKSPTLTVLAGSLSVLPRVVNGVFLQGMAGILGGDIVVSLALRRKTRSRTRRLRLILLSMIFGLLAYCAYVLAPTPAERVGRVAGWPEWIPVILVSGVAAVLPGLAFIRGKRVG